MAANERRASSASSTASWVRPVHSRMADDNRVIMAVAHGSLRDRASCRTCSPSASASLTRRCWKRTQLNRPRLQARPRLSMRSEKISTAACTRSSARSARPVTNEIQARFCRAQAWPLRSPTSSKAAST